MTFKKWQTPPKKGQKLSDVKVEEIKKEEAKAEEEEKKAEEAKAEEEKSQELPNEGAETQETSEEGDSKDAEDESKWATPSEGQWPEEEEKKAPEGVVGNVWGSVVVKPKGRIVFEAQVAPVPMFRLPPDIRQYLMNNGFTTDVWKKDKEWMEKHNVDMEMIAKLKKFLTEKL